LRQAVEALAPVLQKKGNELRCADFSALPEICNDSVKFRQIVLNLLSNAAKFTERGTITVHARVLNESKELEVSVSDTGIGMSEEQQEQIFEAFVQAEQSTSKHYGGSGLGLSICRDFCELMGGSISVESAPGAGSTFRVRLPAVAVSAPEAA
jgi:signal transduction histidine kinase